MKRLCRANWVESCLRLTPWTDANHRNEPADAIGTLHKNARALRSRDVGSADVPARLLRMDATNLKLPNASYDRALVFFLTRHAQSDTPKDPSVVNAADYAPFLTAPYTESWIRRCPCPGRSPHHGPDTNNR